MRPIRLSSSSPVKLKPAQDVLKEARSSGRVIACPTELQSREDVSFDAQPEGWETIVAYLRARHEAMVAQYGPTEILDIDIESGAVDGMDVAGVLITTYQGEEVLLRSEGVRFPEGTLEEARRRGFKTTTAGDIINEWSKGEIPANNWHGEYSPFITRQTQIYRVLVRAFQALR